MKHVSKRHKNCIKLNLFYTLLRLCYCSLYDEGLCIYVYGAEFGAENRKASHL